MDVPFNGTDFFKIFLDTILVKRDLVDFTPLLPCNLCLSLSCNIFIPVDIKLILIHTESLIGDSMKALRREREMLARLMQKRFSEEERKRLFKKWDIPLDSKRRRLQLANRLWSNIQDMNDVRESAAVVAKLIRFVEQGQALKEMFGLSFTPPRMKRRSFGWKNSSASLL